MTGECVGYHAKLMTIHKADRVCNDIDAKLPVPISPEDTEFYGQFGPTHMGVFGDFQKGTVIWRNNYTKVTYSK